MNGETVSDASVSLSPEKILEYENIKSEFSDYTRFEDTNRLSRAESKQRFIDNIDYVPRYKYPKLFFLQDDAVSTSKKTDIYNAVLELDVASKAAEMVGDTARAAEIKLYQRFHDLRLNRMLLVEAAEHLHDARTSSEQEAARIAFMEINQELYGEMNSKWFLSMLTTEYKKAALFTPADENAQVVSSSLKKVFERNPIEEVPEEALLSEEEMGRLHSLILDKYGPLLESVPATDDTVYYDASQCAEIMNRALEVGGLAEKGWVCEINAAKANPTTNGTSKKILLPPSTRRNASELKRLILHEQEVHARRSQNGNEKGSKLLKGGTADYGDVEEGLGVLLECAVNGNLSNPSFDRARERYMAAGLALGLDNGHPRDARETYELLWRIIAIDYSTDGTMSDELIKKAKDRAYSHVENEFRGTDFWMKGVIYTKLKSYYEGLAENALYFKRNKNRLESALDEALIGKFDHTNPEEKALVEAL